MIYPGTYNYIKDQNSSFVIIPFHLSTKFDIEVYQLNKTLEFNNIEEINYYYNSQNIQKYEIWLPDLNGSVRKYELKYQDLIVFYPIYIDFIYSIQFLSGFWILYEYEERFNLRDFISPQISDDYINFYVQIFQRYAAFFYTELNKIGYYQFEIPDNLFCEQMEIIFDLDYYYDHLYSSEDSDYSSDEYSDEYSNNTLNLLPAA